ncbi:heparinase II/III family protein [Halosquirtibacter laminarini]|uniref:Heparinase II/III family protein n=1 Tax=Halosquirtibacter laminarini TaxID=3374600 RepID=A0AC61NHI9_9BACT|nr:heparinase II/III family protein [Prolixibacteraceae bacterium]
MTELNRRMRRIVFAVSVCFFSGILAPLFAKNPKRIDRVLFLKHSISDRDEVKACYPDGVSQTLKVADEVLNQTYLFRYDWDMEKTHTVHQFKGSIDWLAMPNGDPEWCYMLNRHKFWIDLGRAYWLTGDEKYAEKWVQDCTDWIKKNRREEQSGLANAWRRIEVGIRCENWIRTYEFMQGSKALTPEFVALFKKSLKAHGAFLDESYNYFSKTSNWGILENYGLFCLSLFFHDSPEAVQWQKHAIDRLNRSAFLQIGTDGVQWEKSPMYHNEVLHCLSGLVFLADRFKVELPNQVRDITHKMALANVQWMKPNGNQPLFGDSDDTDLGHMWVKSAISTKDPVLVKRMNFSGIDYESYFDLDRRTLKKSKRWKGSDPKYTSVYQQVSGDLYMRDGWSSSSFYGSFHLKNLYCGHGHDDLLHFTVFGHGRDYLIDSGRYTYLDKPERAYFKSSKAHNTIGVDGLDNAVYTSSWSNSWEPSSDYQHVKIASWGVWAEANNTAYSRLDDPVQMKRSMLYIKPSLWVVMDNFHSKKVHQFNQYFNFLNNKQRVEGEVLRTTYPDHNIHVRFDSKVRLSREVSEYSEEYNKKKPASRYITKCEGSELVSLKTLIYDPERGTPILHSVRVTTRTGGEVEKSVAEAFEFIYDGCRYVLFVQQNVPAPMTHFFKVGERFVDAKVALWKVGTAYNKYLLCEF